MIRVLLADDQSLVRAGLPHDPARRAGHRGRRARPATAPRRSPRASAAPDVVLMDIRMPGVDGIEATRRDHRAAQRAPRVLVLTTFDLDEYVYEALRAGASGFLLKDAPEQQLVAAIRVVADGGSLFAPSVTRRLIEQFAAARRRAGARPSSTSSRRASSRCSGSSRAASRTRRSPRSWSSASTRPRPTSRSVLAQARPAQPRAGGRARLRDGPRAPRHPTPAAAPDRYAVVPGGRWSKMGTAR